MLVEASIARVQLTARTFARSSAPFGQPLSEWQSDAANARNCPSEPAVAGRDNGVDFSGVWRPYSLGSSERVLAPGAPKSGQRRADYVPVASAQKRPRKASLDPRRRNATRAFGKEGEVWQTRRGMAATSLLAKRT